jgi:hypothetical protein
VEAPKYLLVKEVLEKLRRVTALKSRNQNDIEGKVGS